jgi:hypothetical protein
VKVWRILGKEEGFAMQLCRHTTLNDGVIFFGIPTRKEKVLKYGASLTL